MITPDLMNQVFNRLTEVGFNEWAKNTSPLFRAQAATRFTEYLQSGSCVMIRFRDLKHGASSCEVSKLPKKP